MAEITVRSIRFPFAGSVNLDRPGPELDEILSSLALSMTMPYLEPYLNRTMKVALTEIGDPVLAEDVRRFSQQEGHHFRNHALLNDEIREQFAASIAERLRGIEEALATLAGSRCLRISMPRRSRERTVSGELPTDRAISTAKRRRPAASPPHWSSRILASGDRN